MAFDRQFVDGLDGRVRFSDLRIAAGDQRIVAQDGVSAFALNRHIHVGPAEGYARATGKVEAETTWRGWVSYLNDLHKGRNTGDAWFWFIDAFAVACVVFTLTGLLLLQLHARHRPSTWPLVGASLAIPLLLALFLIH